MRFLSGSLCVALVLTACGSEPAGSAGSNSAGSSAASASGGAVSNAAASAPSAAQPADGLSLVLESERMRIYPMGDAAIVDTGAFIALLGDGPIEQDPALTKTSFTNESGDTTVSVAVVFDQLFGSWPKQAFGRSSDVPGLQARLKDTWTKQDPTREGETLLAVTPWGDGKAVSFIRMVESDLRSQLVNSSGGIPVPSPGKPTPDQEGCAVRFDPGAGLALAGTPNGQLFAIGTECKTKKPIVERWEAKQVRGIAEVVPGIPEGSSPKVVAAAAADDAIALFADRNRATLVSWDGKAWKAEPSPVGIATSLFYTSNGTAWAVSAEGLYKRPKGAGWAQVPLPEAKSPTSAWAKNDDVLWVVLEGKRLFKKGGQPTGPAITLPPISEVKSIVSRDKRWPATALCKKVYVQLVALGPMSGDPPKSFAGLTETIKADASLAEGIEYVVEEAGNRWVGAKVPSLAKAEKLVAAFKAKNDKAKPLIFCHEPQVIGKLATQ